MAPGGTVDDARRPPRIDGAGPPRRWRLPTGGAAAVALVYLVVGLTWIAFSDRVVAALFPSPDVLARVQTVKGTFFVVATAVLLFFFVRRTERRVSDLAAELRATVDGMADGVFLVDERGYIVEANRAAVTLVGAGSKADILGPIQAWGRRFEVRALDGTPLPLDRYAAVRVLAGDAVAQYEAILRRPDGADVFVSVASTPVLRAGRPPLAVSVLRNVSEGRRLDEMRNEFLATAAHEFRTPLAVIKAYAQLMSRRDEGEQRALAVIQRQVDRLTRLLEDILDSARLHGAVRAARSERFDLAATARAVADRLRPAAPAHALAVDADGPVPVEADRERIARVIANLLENAVRFSPDGGEVRVRVERADAEARVSVADHGIGIPPERQDQVFRRFYRAHAGTPHDYGGLGLGLEVSRAVVERHGGRMWFESAPGAGSTFHFGLPLVEDGP
jgi:signal transduction histidine kinase